MTLKISLSQTKPLQMATELLVVGVPEEALTGADSPVGALVRELVEAVGDSARRAIERADFTGKRDQVVQIVTGGAVKPEQVALIGMGKPASLASFAVRRVVAKGARLAKGVPAVSMAVALPAGVEGAERAGAEGAVLGAYRFESYKTGDRVTKHPLEKVALLVDEKVSAKARAAVELGRQVAECVCYARDLINMAPNDLYPATLADYAVKLSKQHGLTCTVLDDKALKRKGMHLLAAVGQGSVRGPRFIHMTYRPKGAGKKKLKKLVFVGKGLTFDTGGVCLKPAPGMEEMKGDMGGAANVIALMAAVALTQPRAEVHGIIASAENMLGGNSYRPGDVFGSYDGKTVEIINTDAEGRLALADALAYGRELKPDFMLCNATLTGACVVALGPTVSGFYVNRDALAEQMRKAAEEEGEAMWHMPLVEDLREMLKSDWADIKHVGERWGGSITAALFLREFVGDVPWVHVDIAGPSMASKAYDVFAKGGTGHGVLTFLRLIENMVAGGD